MKYIHLVLYNKDPIFDKMKEITEKYYNSFDNVTTIYYCYNNDINTEYKLEGNILYIKGGVDNFDGSNGYNYSVDTSILNKTIKAFEFIKKNKYIFDYVIRSNISTIVDFKLLDEELNINPVEYYSGGDFYCNNISIKVTIHDIIKDFNHIYYFQGTAILLSKKGFNFILNNKHVLEPTMDDMSIGILFTSYCDYFKKNKLISIGKMVSINDKIILNKSNIIKNKYTFYRNKDLNDRKLDLIRMKKIISIIK